MLTEDEIDDEICRIMMEHGPDGHVDGHELLTEFVMQRITEVRETDRAGLFLNANQCGAFFELITQVLEGGNPNAGTRQWLETMRNQLARGAAGPSIKVDLTTAPAAPPAPAGDPDASCFASPVS